MQQTFAQLVMVTNREDKVPLLIVRRHRLRSKEVQIDKLIALREIAESESLRVAFAQEQVDLGEVGLGFCLRFVFRKGESAHRLLSNGIGKRLRQEQPIFD